LEVAVDSDLDVAADSDLGVAADSDVPPVAEAALPLLAGVPYHSLTPLCPLHAPFLLVPL
jgi:hypothetical protein